LFAGRGSYGPHRTCRVGGKGRAVYLPPRAGGEQPPQDGEPLRSDGDVHVWVAPFADRIEVRVSVGRPTTQGNEAVAA
jgi:hypothetical protein